MPQQPPRSGRPDYRKPGPQKITASLCKEAGAQGNNRSKELLQSPPPPPGFSLVTPPPRKKEGAQKKKGIKKI